MKVVGISGSARKDGNTAILINHVFAELEAEGWMPSASSSANTWLIRIAVFPSLRALPLIPTTFMISLLRLATAIQVLSLPRLDGIRALVDPLGDLPPGCAAGRI